MAPKPETQAESAERMYEYRASTYEDSWHPDYSKRFVSLIGDLKPGSRVLDLCVGTGLEAFLAADIVGDEGHVVGVDITRAMLAEAAARKEREPELGRRITLLRHDVTNLASLAEVQPASFDVILCSNAFVLFDDPAGVVRGWKAYLRPGGVMAIDIAHEHNFRSGIVMERVAARMGVAWPSNRAWVRSKDSFKDILEAEGLVVEKAEELNKISDRRETYYSVDQADEQFNWVAKAVLSVPMMTDEFQRVARPLFRDEFAKAATDGKVEIVDSLYLYVARKP